ncbi:MAG TPA: ABC transporter substrate-binding protein, partial [Terriglobales bacterium]|nr:ABC transporter substrate-binding protein [Terriglobales bacterium]
NAARYIREFTRAYPFTHPRVWRGKSRDVTQRIIAEALSARFSVDVVKPSVDLLPPLLHRNLIGRYESPLRAALSPWARGPLWTNINYAYRVFAFNPKKLARKDVPASWEDLLQPRFRGAILFDESSLHEVISLLAAWGREKTVNYFDRLSRQRLLICAGRDTMLAMMMAGEAPVAITAYAYHSEALRARGAPIDWMAEDVIPTLVYPLALARHAPHPYTAALFYDFLISERGQRMIAEDGRVVAHPNVQPIYPRMKGLQASLAAEQTQINSLARTEKYFREALRILDSVILKRER